LKRRRHTPEQIIRKLREADNARRLKELESENAKLKRTWPTKLQIGALKELERRKLVSPTRRRRGDHLQQLFGCPQRWACRLVGQHHGTQRRQPLVSS
jgi:hypothetical protein